MSQKAADTATKNLQKDLVTLADNFADPDVILVKQLEKKSNINPKDVPAAFLCAVQNKRAENIQRISDNCTIDSKTKAIAQAIAKKQRLADAQELRKTYEQLQQLLLKHALNNSIVASLGISSSTDDFDQPKVLGKELSGVLDNLANAGEDNSRTRKKKLQTEK